MRYIILFFFPLTLFAETITTNNLITNGNFENGNSNGWTTSGEVVVLNDCCGSNYDLEFGLQGSIEQNFDLVGDNITQTMLNNGITLNSSVLMQNGECAVAGCWGGQGGIDTFTIRLQIKDADNNVLATTTQERQVATGINGENFTDSVSYTESGSNIGNIFISGSDTNGVAGGLGAGNVDNVIVTMTYDDTVLSATQSQQLTTTFQEIEELIEKTEEIIPESIEELFIEEVFFELVQAPELEFEIFEELIIEEIAEEEINTGIVNVFFEPITTEEIQMSELPSIETIEEIPLEEFYEERPSLSEQTELTELSETEVGETIEETNVSGGESESIVGTEETTTGQEETTTTVAESGESIQEEEPSTNNTGESEEEITVAETETEESNTSSGRGESSDESETSSTGEQSEDRETETQTAEEDIDTNNESTDTNIQNISVEKIRQKVESVIKEVDKQLVVTNLIVAKSMQSNINIDNYALTNNDIFDNQLVLDGGEYLDSLIYNDNRNIYQQSQVMYNDDYSKYQKDIDDAVANTIRAKEHLRRIRGY